MDNIKSLHVVSKDDNAAKIASIEAVKNFDVPIIFREEIKLSNGNYYIYERNSYYYLVREKDSKILMYTSNYELILGKLYEGDLSNEK